MKKNSYIPSLFTTSYELAHLDAVDIVKYQKWKKLNLLMQIVLIVLMISSALLIRFKAQSETTFLIPIVLLIASKMVFFIHKNWSFSFILFLFLSFTFQFIISFFGIFSISKLQFEGTLFLQPFAFSFMAALLSLLLNYGVAVIVSHSFSKSSVILKSIFGALVIASFSIIIDYFALHHHFLSPNIYIIPLEKIYITFAAAFLSQYCYHKFCKNSENNIAVLFVILLFVSLLIM